MVSNLSWIGPLNTTTKKTCLHPREVGEEGGAPLWVEAGAVHSWVVLKGGAEPSDRGTRKGRRPPPGSASPRHVSASGGSGGVACTRTAAAPAGKQPSMSKDQSLSLLTGQHKKLGPYLVVYDACIKIM